MKEEIKIFFTALMFYTRIPCPSWVNHDAEYLNKATRYFPLIGWLVGAAMALVAFAAGHYFSLATCAVFTMVASVLITGAFHEDGFADVCDAFGGGWTKADILRIMKDSRIGAYGMIGMCLMLLMKFSVLSSMTIENMCIIVFVAAAVSRWCATTFIFTHEYVRENEDSKAKPIAKSVNRANLIIASIFGLLPLLLLNPTSALIVLGSSYLAKYFLSRYFTKWIGGYTGDCLGATQQVCELVIYLSYVLTCTLML